VYFSSDAVAVNSDGHVVGTLGKPGHSPDFDTQDSFLWDGQSLSFLDDLLSGGSSFTPSAINAAGQVSGFSSGGASPERAMVYTNGGLTPLADLAGASASRAFGINADGVVAGSAVLADGSRAVGWWDAVPQDLNTLLLDPPDLVLEEASAVNDLGQILAWGADRTDPSHVRIRSFLLTPITPATALDGLIDVVLGMDLPHGTETSLLSKLEAARAALAAGDTAGACAALQAFINETGAQAGKKIPLADAEAAIALAERIRQMLGCS
jgi:probable HAF family extracellular repeat protein